MFVTHHLSIQTAIITCQTLRALNFAPLAAQYVDILIYIICKLKTNIRQFLFEWVSICYEYILADGVMM